METFFLYLLKSCGLILVFLGFYHLLLNKDTSFKNNRRFLLGGILASAILPGVYFTRKVIIETVAPTFSMIEADLPAMQPIPEEPAISGYQILFVLYLFGVAIMLSRMILQLFSLKKIISSGNQFQKDGYKYVQTSKKIAPFSFLNYIVYNPNLYSASELENILKHERIHVNQWHTLDVFLANLNLVYQWFNPFAWNYLKTLQQNLEYVADSEAVKNSPCKKEYQKTLLKISVENLNLSLTNSFYQSFIKKRIVMLNNNSKSKNLTWKTALIFPLLLAFLLLFNVKTEAQINFPKESTTKVTTQRISGTISKESEESSLNFIKKVFEKENIQLDFENIQRSENGIITAITVNLLNKTTNASGNFTKNDPDGINTFEIFVEDEEIGFADVSASAEKGKTARDVLSKVGTNPLYIINGKEYTSEQLDGKTIAMDAFVFIDAENARSKYGDKAKDGVIFISEGTILEDLTPELQEIYRKNEKITKTFLQVKKNEKPHIWEVSNNPDDTSEENRVRVSVSSKASAASSVGGDPIYILNGKVVERIKVNSIDEDNIHEIKVLKGDNAVSVYGNAAKDGAILITTKPSSTFKVVSATSFSTDKEEKMALYNKHKNGKMKALVILDGEKQPKNFDLNSIDPDKIEAINVQKGKDIAKKYGKAAKDGVIIISTEKAKRTGLSSFNLSETNRITITGETDNIIASQMGTRSNPANVFYYPQEEKPLIIVDGKEKENGFKMESIAPEEIASVNVLKRDSATEKYGDKGKNGIIEITLKTSSEKGKPAGTFSVIKAATTDNGLKVIKQQLQERANLVVDFEDVKRNREGLIKELKVIAKTENEEIIGTFSESESIDEIYIGVIKDKIYLSSNAPKK